MPELTIVTDGSASATPTPAPGTAPGGSPSGSPAAATLPANPPAPTTPPAAEWRAGPDSPPWARGKTTSEILATGDQMFGILQRFNQQGNVPASNQPSLPPANGAELPMDEYVSGRQVQDYVTRLAQQSIAPQLAELARISTGGTLAYLRQTHAEDFKRWGPEIEGYIADLQPAQRDLDNLERVVKYVRSEHLPELLADQERTLRQQFQNEMVSPGLRSSGAPGAGPVPQTTDYSLASDKLPSEWRERAQRAGLTERQVDEFCAANNLTRETFFKDMLMGGQVSTDKAVARG